MSVKTIEELAAKFSVDLRGIPWEDYEQEYGVTAEEMVYDYSLDESGSVVPGVTTVGYTKDIMADMRKAKSIVNTIDMSWSLNTERAKKAWNDVKAGTLPVSQAALDSFKRDFYSMLPSSSGGAEINVEDLRATISSIYLTAIYGAEIQIGFKMQHAGMPAEEIIEHAELVAQAFNVLTFYEDNGLLVPLKKAEFRPGPEAKTGIQSWIEKSVSGGLGEPLATGVIVAIAVVAVAVVAAICWTMVAMKKISATNKVLKNVCDKAVETGAPEDEAACAKLMEMNNVATDNGPSFGLDQITKWALIAGAGYLLFLFGPSIAATIERRMAQSDRKAFQK